MRWGDDISSILSWFMCYTLFLFFENLIFDVHNNKCLLPFILMNK